MTTTTQNGHTDGTAGDVVEWIQHEAGSAATLEATFQIVTEMWAVAGPFTFIHVYNNDAFEWTHTLKQQLINCTNASNYNIYWRRQQQ